MKLIEVALLVLLLPLFAEIAFSAWKTADREYQGYLTNVRNVYSEREIVRKFKKFCIDGEKIQKEEVRIEEKAFKDGKTLLKASWNQIEIYGISTE